MASLIDQSVSGGTLEEACTTLVHRALRQENRAKEVAKLLVQAFLMGLSDKQNLWNLRLEQVFTEDGDFFSLTGGLSHLVTLYELQDLYQTRNYLKLEEMMESCFRNSHISQITKRRCQFNRIDKIIRHQMPKHIG